MRRHYQFLCLVSMTAVASRRPQTLLERPNKPDDVERNAALDHSVHVSGNLPKLFCRGFPFCACDENESRNGFAVFKVITYFFLSGVKLCALKKSISCMLPVYPCKWPNYSSLPAFLSSHYIIVIINYIYIRIYTQIHTHKAWFSVS